LYLKYELKGCWKQIPDVTGKYKQSIIKVLLKHKYINNRVAVTRHVCLKAI